MPPAALKLIGQLLGAMSPGRAISVVPSQNEFTAVKAAHFLNVSRPFVIKEIELGRLPHRMVGTHRRIAFGDLMADANEMRERRVPRVKQDESSASIRMRVLALRQR
jgi:excisionase family DNA binding protein